VLLPEGRKEIKEVDGFALGCVVCQIEVWILNDEALFAVKFDFDQCNAVNELGKGLFRESERVLVSLESKGMELFDVEEGGNTAFGGQSMPCEPRIEFCRIKGVEVDGLINFPGAIVGPANINERSDVLPEESCFLEVGRRGIDYGLKSRQFPIPEAGWCDSRPIRE
jgi:hypothetical protein